MKARKFLSVFLVLCIVMSCVGCGGASSTSSATSSSVSEPAKEEPKEESSTIEAVSESTASEEAESSEESSSAPEAADSEAGLNIPEKPESLGDWPNRPITFIVPNKPGGSNYSYSEIMNMYAKDYFGVDVVLTSIEGGSGVTGMLEVANADPDGYTIGMAHTGTTVAKPWLEELPFDPMTDFTFLYSVFISPRCLVVRKDFPADTLEEFVQEVSDHEGEYLWGVSGINGVGHVGAVVVLQSLGIYGKATLVPYQNAADNIVALLGGHCDFATFSVAECAEYVKSGDLKLLYMSTDKPWEDPDAPYMTAPVCAGDLGYETFASSGAFIAPAGMDPVLAQYISDVYKAIFNDPRTQEEFRKRGFLPTLRWTGYEDCGQMIHDQYETCGETIKKYILEQ